MASDWPISHFAARYNVFMHTPANPIGIVHDCYSMSLFKIVNCYSRVFKFSQNQKSCLKIEPKLTYNVQHDCASL